LAGLCRTTLLKAQYFLEQATKAEFDPKLLADPNWLPFAANLEAAIIYGHSSIDHLHKEFVRTYKSKGYRRWHDKQWEALCTSKPVCRYLAERRNFIVHEEPEKTHAHVFLEAVGIAVGLSASVNMTVTRANGTVERIERPTEVPENPRASVYESPSEPPKPSSPRRHQQFFFANTAWQAKSAVDYVGEFVDAIRQFIADADTKFQP
jgi:hypothetical protein